MVVLGASASGAAAQLGVYVGYADTLRANPTHFPTPWAPEVHVDGATCLKKTCDNGAIRLVNNDKKPVKVKSVVVKLGTCSYNSWPHNFSIGSGKQVILGNEGHKGETGCSKRIGGFDTSDVGPHGRYWSGHCNSSGIVPEVVIATASGTTKLRDTGRVLNTGGIDKAKCPKGTGSHNESEQWTPIGSKPCPTAVLRLAPPTQTRHVHTAATVTATLRNSGGPHCGRPLQGAVVRFRVLSGPNQGKTAGVVTNKSGKAQFTYTSAHTGIDTLQASVKNPTGRLFSNKVKVKWLTAPHRRHRAGTFSCEGTGATLLTLTFAVANPMDSPCRTHSASVASVSGKKSLAVTAHAVSASTLLKAGRLAQAGDTAQATARVAKATIGAIPGHRISLGVVTSTVTERCVKSGSGLKLVRTSKSSVANLKIDGKKTKIINKPEKIPLGPLATIWLNRIVRQGHTLMRRAVQIDLGGKTILILAQSQTDYTGSPCSNTR